MTTKRKPTRRNPTKDFRSLSAAQKFHEKLMQQGHAEAGVLYDAASGKYRVMWKEAKKNPQPAPIGKWIKAKAVRVRIVGGRKVLDLKS